nr:growth-regulating factor 3 [Triticum aestivum]UVH33669.1 growth-regulating factor 3 [Triticum aestivum]UVH33670.1 growth-regulating factor 3 [Triticum aestivum]UVH33671.1 growth-regulating factor 3 [Triticum aestivum]UVH33672.1 growth-regulating factor 3 [Triticum aestivum]
MAMPFASLSPAADHHRSSPIFPFCRSSPLYSAGEEAAQQQQQQQHAMSGARWAAARPATFTAAQYEELEQQALIYKYLVAGVPVPPDLLLPIRRGFDSLASRFYHHHALGYGSYFGKKLDPEPGRCRRTDGKKWRCSKEAAQDSKYCERHMHRGRNRSRKPVETHLVSHSQQLQQQAPAAAFHGHSPYPAIATGAGAPGSFALGSTAQLHMDNAAAPYATAGAAGNKDFRYSAYGFRTSAMEDHNQFISAAMDTAMDNYSWRLLPAQNSSFSLSSYPMLSTLSDLDQSAICSLAKTEREPLSFFGVGGGFDDDESAVKQENQTLRPFFDEWPKDRDSWPELQDHDSNHNNEAFSATKLSISIPVTSSDFSTTAGSRSPHGIYSR